MRIFFILIFSLLSIVGLNAQQESFSDSVVISLLTCSPGEEVYAKFGHSGIRVFDPLNNQDVVFNYGLFNFNTKNFYYKFIKGETDYLLGVQQTSDFLAEYKQRNSQVWEQVLNLTITEKQKIIEALLINYRPENRMYRYNFIFDNCATRPRDQVANNISGYIKLQNSSHSKTYRQWVAEYVGHDTWVNFGIDLVFGVQADHLAQQYESMFLPEVLMNEFEVAEINSKDKNNDRKLVLKNNVLVQSVYTPKLKPSFFSKPFQLLFAVLILVTAFCIYEFRFRKHIVLIDSILLFSSGVAGVIVSYLMFFSIHPLVKMNLNILWLNPLNIIAAFLIWSKPLRFPMFVYQLFNLVLLLLALIVFALSVQTFNASSFPIMVILLLRYSTWIVKMKHRIFRKSKFAIKGFKM